jgi:hypothetical protein
MPPPLRRPFHVCPCEACAHELESELAEAFRDELARGSGGFLDELEASDDDEGDDAEEASDQEESKPGTNDQGNGPKGPLFPLGQVVSMPGALAALTTPDIETALRRHVAGDWGEVDADDRAENNLSVREGFRVLSAYRGKDNTRFWDITEADRLPDEY